MNRIIPLVIVVVLLALTFVMCGRGILTLDEVEYPPVVEGPIPDKSKPEPAPEFEPEPEPEHNIQYRNPLTGLSTDTDISHLRPLAIVINNLSIAQPQLGVSQADIIYEVPVEGGLTRMLAVFQDISVVEAIGSVRSARDYFIDLAQGHDAIFIFAGGSPGAYTVLSNRNITRLDGVHGRHTDIFFRNQERQRIMGFEHSLLTSGELISRYLPTYDFRLEHHDDFESALKFGEIEDVSSHGGNSVTDFTVRFSAGKSTAFSFDADSGLYYVSQHGGAYADGNDNTQVAATNVLVLYTTVSVIDSAGRLRITLTGNGRGYLFSGGSYVEIEWSKESYSAPFVYSLLDGTPLVLGRGKTYICIVPNAYGVVR
ncbi:MAG: DUF3048 domain-containing protein [Oscillospiraceae bacterium]|nr:DUF3048 domain-containing protein [Oscillospiraceae bacterium]